MIPVSTQALRTAAGPGARVYIGESVLNKSFRAALFSQHDFNVFVREDGANLDVSSQGDYVITECSEFDLGSFFEAGNFALLHLHGKGELSLSHLSVFAQFVKRHAFENSVGALFSTGAAGLGHQLVRNAVVGEGLFAMVPFLTSPMGITMLCSSYVVKLIYSVAFVKEQGVIR